MNFSDFTLRSGQTSDEEIKQLAELNVTRDFGGAGVFTLFWHLNMLLSVVIVIIILSLSFQVWSFWGNCIYSWKWRWVMVPRALKYSTVRKKVVRFQFNCWIHLCLFENAILRALYIYYKKSCLFFHLEPCKKYFSNEGLKK